MTNNPEWPETIPITLVRIAYEREAHVTDLQAKCTEAYEPKKNHYPPKPRGDAATAFVNATAQHAAEYTLPFEHHNPMEPYASTVVWETNGKITVYDKTQGMQI